MRLRSLIFILLCCNQWILCSPPIIVDVKTDGFSNSTITRLTRDSYGYIWIGTRRGLYRYDGYHYKKYESLKNDSNSIPGNDISAIFEDHQKNLWIGTDSGLCTFSHRLNTFIRRHLPKEFMAWGVQIFEDSKNNLWLGVSSGVWRYDFVKNTFIHYNPVSSGYGKGGVACFFEDRDKQLWVSNWHGGLSSYKPETDRFINYPRDKESDLVVSYMAQTPDGRIWLVGTGGELYKFENKDYIKIFDNIYTGRIINRFLFVDIDGILWMANQNSMVRYDPSNGVKDEFRMHYPNSSIVCAILSGFYDKKDDIIWIGTDHGLKKVILKQWAAKYVYDKTLGNAVVQMGHWVNDSLFGLWGEKNLIFDKKGNKKEIGTKQKLSLILGDDLIWAYKSGNNNEIFSYNYKTNVLEKTKFMPVDSINRSFSNFYTLANGDRVLSNTDKKDFYYNCRNNKCIELNKRFGQPGITKNFKGCFLKKDTIVVVYQDTLFYWNPDKDVIMRTQNIHLNARLVYLKDDIAWIFTLDSIYFFNLTTGGKQAYIYPYGNRNTINRCIDKNNRLWMSYFERIFCIDHVHRDYLCFKIDQIIHYHPFCFDINPNNQLLIGGECNYLTCDADSFLLASEKSKIRLTRLLINGEEVTPEPNGILKQDIFFTRSICLKPAQSSVAVEFASDEYVFPESIIYEYRLDAIETNWTKCSDGTNLAKYSKLPAGKYVLKIRKQNKPAGELSLAIEILPNWWQTRWFMMIIGLVLALAVYAFTLFRTHRIREHNKQLERLVEERMLTIRQQNEQLQLQTTTLLEQREEMQALNEELRAQSEELFYTNKQLQKLNATKDRFFSIIAHDLKNPFNAVLGLSDILVTKKAEVSEEYHEIAVNINESSKLIFSLLQNLLEWAKSQLNSTKFEPEQFKLNEIINTTIGVLQLNAANKKIHLINECPNDMSVFADKNMITTVIRNMINNAIKFTPVDGKITVTAALKDAMVELRITDTGIGMTEEDIKKLFQIDTHHTTSGTSGELGTGLGLIICKEFIDKNKGAIRVESKIGKGSRFIISLPTGTESEVKRNNTGEQITVKKSDAIIPQQEINLPPRDKDSPWVLIVEDNEGIRINIKTCIEKYFSCCEAINGKEGLTKAFSEMPDIIISDWMMPEMEGIELCTILKKDERTSHIPVILLTAKADMRDKIEGLETGADDYLTKPFNTQELLLRIHNLLESRKKVRERVMKELLIESKDLGLNSTDNLFLQKAITLVEKHIEDSEFDISQFTEEIGLSRSQLHKKLTALTNQSATEFVRTIRLKKAAQFIAGGLNVTEVYYRVGFNSRSHFIKSFTELFGVSPSEYKTKK